MLLFKVITSVLLVLAVAADKKIELQDIEEDNLKSEREKQYEKIEVRSEDQGATAHGSVPLEYLKNNFIHYYDAPSPTTQQPRFVQQYAVTESPEGASTGPKPQYGPASGPAQQTFGYLSNVPMQIYLVPQYYQEAQQSANTQQGVQYAAPPLSQVSGYPSGPESVQQHPNYIVPTYVAPAGNRFVQQYTTPVTYIGYPQPTLSPQQPSATPLLTYQTPVVPYPTALAPPPTKNYQHNPQFDTNTIEDHGAGVHGQKQYSQPQLQYNQQIQEFPRYYNSRAPVGDEYRTSNIELPHPSPLLLKPSPPHLSHIPKALPVYRPLTKPIYGTGNALISNTFTPKPSDAYGVPFKRRPTSLLDSYIPSSVQLEYLKRGYTRDTLSAYEALSGARNGYPSIFPVPKYYERGFLPNQMYHTAAGGVTFGPHKRAPKI